MENGKLRYWGIIGCGYCLEEITRPLPLTMEERKCTHCGKKEMAIIGFTLKLQY